MATFSIFWGEITDLSFATLVLPLHWVSCIRHTLKLISLARLCHVTFFPKQWVHASFAVAILAHVLNVLLLHHYTMGDVASTYM